MLAKQKDKFRVLNYLKSIPNITIIKILLVYINVKYLTKNH